MYYLTVMDCWCEVGGNRWAGSGQMVDVDAIIVEIRNLHHKLLSTSHLDSKFVERRSQFVASLCNGVLQGLQFLEAAEQVVAGAFAARLLVAPTILAGRLLVVVGVWDAGYGSEQARAGFNRQAARRARVWQSHLRFCQKP